MKTFNIQLRGLSFPVVTNLENTDAETLTQGLDCILPETKLIPIGVQLILVTCLNTGGGDKWTLHFNITNEDWPDVDPEFAEDFALDIQSHLEECEEDLPYINQVIDTTYRTLTIIYHAG